MIGGGQLLECAGGQWILSDGGVCPQVCSSVFGMDHDFIGCAGEGASYVCLCQASDAAACSSADDGCDGGTTLELCVDGQLAVANCTQSDCDYTDPVTYTCT